MTRIEQKPRGKKNVLHPKLGTNPKFESGVLIHVENIYYRLIYLISWPGAIV